LKEAQHNFREASRVNHSRRQLIVGISFVGAGTLLAGCRQTSKSVVTETSEQNKTEDTPEGAKEEGDVTAIEDLMREHGVLRRALLVYQEAAGKLRDQPGSVPTEALEKVAQLFRAFGEDYHEKKLEEAFIFPAVKKGQSPASAYVDVLLEQHLRGREITSYVLAVTGSDKIPTNNTASFVKALESFVRMYEHHAALEDTVIFPAWKAALREGELDEMGAKFEEIEQEQFGGDGFDAALKRMADIEESLGLAKLEMFTAPPPPVQGTPK
jgi:hemerythrin-like domain-containing protein